MSRNSLKSQLSIYSCRKHKTRQFGFTLVELIAVVVILGMLAGVTGLSIRSYMISAKQHTAKMEISKIRQALETFATVHDRYPTSEEGLRILATGTEKFAKQLDKLPQDPWGHQYIYLIPGNNVDYEVISYGADGREGGTGADTDISSIQFEVSSEAK